MDDEWILSYSIRFQVLLRMLLLAVAKKISGGETFLPIKLILVTFSDDFGIFALHFVFLNFFCRSSTCIVGVTCTVVSLYSIYKSVIIWNHLSQKSVQETPILYSRKQILYLSIIHLKLATNDAEQVGYVVVNNSS